MTRVQSVVMETAECVCGRKKCRNDKQRTRWWNKEVETAVRKKIAYKRWLQVKTREAKEEYLILKRAAGHEVRKAKMTNGGSWENGLFRRDTEAKFKQWR